MWNRTQKLFRNEKRNLNPSFSPHLFGCQSTWYPGTTFYLILVFQCTKKIYSLQHVTSVLILSHRLCAPPPLYDMFVSPRCLCPLTLCLCEYSSVVKREENVLHVWQHVMNWTKNPKLIRIHLSSILFFGKSIQQMKHLCLKSYDNWLRYVACKELGREPDVVDMWELLFLLQKQF